MNQEKQPESLRLADALEYISNNSEENWQTFDATAAELRRLHAQNTEQRAELVAENLQLAMESLANRDRIADLEAQLSAIGAGGVESLLKRECLHQITEPAPQGETVYAALPEPSIGAHDDGRGGEYPDTFAAYKMYAFADATAALRAPRAPAQECGNCFEGKSDLDHTCRKCSGSGIAPAQAVAVPECFFSYCDDDGFNKHDTLEAAKAASQDMIDMLREEAGTDEWPGSTGSVCYGVIVGQSTEVPGEQGPGGEETADYVLLAAAPAHKGGQP